MITVASIVEGDGEVGALPVLLRRLGSLLSPDMVVEIQKPIRVRRDRFLNKDAELHRYIALAKSKCGENGWILILLDADDDCPAEQGAALLRKAAQQAGECPVSAVFARREYEAWFIASATALHGKRGFSFEEPPVADPESTRDAKGWLSARMAGKRYWEVKDQPAFSSLIDIEQTRRYSRSFRKLCSEWEKNINQDARRQI